MASNTGGREVAHVVGFLARATARQDRGYVDDVVDLGYVAGANVVLQPAGVIVTLEHTLTDVLRCTT
jgi:hypothetical protein